MLTRVNINFVGELYEYVVMKKLADKATEYLNNKMEDGSEISEQDIHMAALVCRVRELEELYIKLEDYYWP